MRIGFLYLTDPFKQITSLRLTWGCAIVFSLAAVAQPSMAVVVPTTFAQFHQSPTNINTNVFAYIDNGPAPTFDSQLVSDPSGVVGGALPVIFSYLSVAGSLPADLSGSQDAKLTLTSSSKSPVATAFTPVIGDQQILGNGTLVDKLAIIRNTAAAEGNGLRTNLLTMTFTGQLIGAIGGAPQLSGDQSLGFNVTFTSDFLTFAGSSNQFSLTFSSWSSGLRLSTIASDLYFQSATANGTGTFASVATAVPEPTTWTLGMIGLSVLMVGYLRRRRGRFCKS